MKEKQDKNPFVYLAPTPEEERDYARDFWNLAAKEMKEEKLTKSYIDSCEVHLGEMTGSTIYDGVDVYDLQKRIENIEKRLIPQNVLSVFLIILGILIYIK